jgi:transposase
VQHVVPTEQGMRWRTEEDGLPPGALCRASPSAPDAHDARTDTTSWVGYPVHLTQTYQDDAPHLLTHGATTAAPVADGETPPTVHLALQGKGLLPAIHLVDTGSLDAALWVTSHQE